MRTLKLEFIREGNFSFHDVLDGLKVILRFEGCSAGHKFIDGDSECPKINHLIIASSLKHLWCSEVRSSGESEHLSFPSPFLNLFTDSKINEFNILVLLIIEYILGFDVSMTNLFGMDVFESVKQLVRNDF